MSQEKKIILLDDVLNYLSEATTIQLVDVSNTIQGLLIDAKDGLFPTNYYDSEKIEILKRLFDKYNLEQLEKFEKLLTNTPKKP